MAVLGSSRPNCRVGCGEYLAPWQLSIVSPEFFDHHGLGAVSGAAVQFAPVLDHLAVRSGLCLCCDHHGQYLQKVSLTQLTVPLQLARLYLSTIKIQFKCC